MSDFNTGAAPPRRDISFSEPALSIHLRPLTWSIWCEWVIVCALFPVCSTISSTAFEKQISRNADHAALIADSLLVLVVFATVIPPLLQMVVLKRVLPRLGVTFWLFCIVISAGLWLVLIAPRYGYRFALFEAGFRSQPELQMAALRQSFAGTLTVSRILSLPWTPFLLWTIATSALISFLPAVALGTASGPWRATLLFLAAAIIGALASGVVGQLYQMAFDSRSFDQWALNGLCWACRFHVLASRAGVGAVWGATTAIVVVLLARQFPDRGAPNGGCFAIRRAGGLTLVLIAPLAIALLAPFVGYLAGQDGIIAGVPELREVLSFAPSEDRSQGEAILAYSHDITVSLPRVPQVAIAPDGQTAIVRTFDHELVQVDIGTGHVLRQLASALAPLESYVVAWSPDGRYLALRSEGREVPIANTHYTQNQSRVRLYTLPDLVLAADVVTEDVACFDVQARETMVFSADSKSLWLECGQFYAPTPDDLVAVQFDVPAMRTRDVRRYGESAEGGQIESLERAGDSVWATQFGSNRKPFRIRDLTHDQEIVTVPMPLELIGDLTAQNSEVDEKSIQLSFCGVPPGLPASSGPSFSICRILSFDTRTGALINKLDKEDYRMANPEAHSPNSTLSGQGLRIESYWRIDSKVGELVVSDGVSGHQRQKIVSVAQRPLQMSADGRWLITIAIYGGDLRVYRVHG